MIATFTRDPFVFTRVPGGTNIQIQMFYIVLPGRCICISCHRTAAAPGRRRRSDRGRGRTTLFSWWETFACGKRKCTALTPRFFRQSLKVFFAHVSFFTSLFLSPFFSGSVNGARKFGVFLLPPPLISRILSPNPFSPHRCRLARSVINGHLKSPSFPVTPPPPPFATF